MPAVYLLDTNAVIDFFNNRLPPKGAAFMGNINEPAISVITNIELFASAKITLQERLQLEQFVGIATIFDKVDAPVVKQTITIRQLYKIPLPDAVIAATALVYGLDLVSRNTADFNNIPGLTVINPHTL